MTDAIFRGLGKYADGINGFLRTQFGVIGTAQGDHFVLSASTVDRMLSEDALRIHPQLRLEKDREREIAETMYKQIPAGMKQFQLPELQTVPFADGYGKLSQLDRAEALLAVAREERVRDVLAETVIPVMISEFKADFVTGVSLDDQRQQAWISFNKNSMLMERYAPEEAARRVRNGALAGALPDCISIQAFLDAITRLSPLMFTLPIHRLGCAWHFQCRAMVALMAAPANGLVFRFMSVISPLAADTHLFGLHGLTGMSEEMIWRYLKFCVAGLNRLMRFLHDPRSFLRDDGSVDLLKKNQAYSAVHLLFADIAANNFSTTAHNRISYAMSALDKFANLRAKLGAQPESEYSEDAAMVEFASKSQAAELKRAIDVSMSSMNYDGLCGLINAVIDQCYGALHRCLGEQDSAAKNSERARLNRIRSQRNLRHGTFLKRDQFETLFFESNGVVPDTIATLPLLLTLGFIADPAAFLAFRPTVAN